MIFSGATFGSVPFAAKLDTLEVITRRRANLEPGESFYPVNDPVSLPAIPKALLYIDFRRRPLATQSRLRMEKGTEGTFHIPVAFAQVENPEKVLLDFSRSIDSQYLGTVV